jgi:hypothetical protein
VLSYYTPLPHAPTCFTRREHLQLLLGIKPKLERTTQGGPVRLIKPDGTTVVLYA